jgi:hypothetical protein
MDYTLFFEIWEGERNFRSAMDHSFWGVTHSRSTPVLIDGKLTGAERVEYDFVNTQAVVTFVNSSNPQTSEGHYSALFKYSGRDHPGDIKEITSVLKNSLGMRIVTQGSGRGWNSPVLEEVMKRHLQ